MRRATSRAASSPGHHRFGLYGGLVLAESRFARAVPARRGARASPRASRWWQSGSWRRRSSRWRWCRGRSAAHLRAEPPPAEAEAEMTCSRATRPEPSSRSPTAPASRRRCCLIMLAEQTFLNAGPLIVKATEGGAEGAALAGLRVQRAADRARAAAALPGRPDLDPPPPHPADRPGRGRSVPAQREHDARRDRRVRRARGPHDARGRPVPHGPPLRRPGGLRPRRPRDRVGGHGPLPRCRDPEPGRAREGAGAPGRGLLGVRGGAVRRLPGDPRMGGPRPAGRDRLRRRARWCSSGLLYCSTRKRDPWQSTPR